MKSPPVTQSQQGNLFEILVNKLRLKSQRPVSTVKGANSVLQLLGLGVAQMELVGLHHLSFSPLYEVVFTFCNVIVTAANKSKSARARKIILH